MQEAVQDPFVTRLMNMKAEVVQERRKLQEEYAEVLAKLDKKIEALQAVVVMVKPEATGPTLFSRKWADLAVLVKKVSRKDILRRMAELEGGKVRSADAAHFLIHHGALVKSKHASTLIWHSLDEDELFEKKGGGVFALTDEYYEAKAPF